MVNKTTGTITTVAGNGQYAYSGDNGPATNASLNYPYGLAFDSNGNMYIADTDNNRIRMVNVSTQNISTVVGTGNGTFGGDNGPATSAQLNNPTGIAFDIAGNLYITDSFNHRIRMVNASTGNISTIAGNGSNGYSGDNGLATDAGISYPYGIALDSVGNVFFSDKKDNRIRMVNASTRIIYTYAGNGNNTYSGDNGPATNASFSIPEFLNFDTAWNLYIAEENSNCVRMVNASNKYITTIAGIPNKAGSSGDGGPATAAELQFASGVVLNSAGDLYIADTKNGRIRIVYF